MTNVLDVSLGELGANRPLEARAIRAIQLSTGESWIDAYGKLREGADLYIQTRGRDGSPKKETKK